MNTINTALVKQEVKVHKIKLAAVFASSLVLLACGGGGGSGGGPTPPPTQPPPQANRAPTISGEAITEVVAGEAYSFRPTASDPDGDTLRFTAENLADWMSFDTATGEITGMPSSFELGSTENIVIAVSDGSLSSTMSPFTVSVNPAKVSKDDVVSNGPQNPIPTDELSEGADSGFTTEGDVELTIAGELVMIEDADLKVEFDSDENLVSLVGEGVLPPAIGDHFAINSRTKVRMGLYKGSEVNADPDLDILLKDDFYYLVHYIGVSTDVEIGDRNGGQGESITLSLPLSGEILIVGDPLDSFYYYYANTPFGIQGIGESDQGFIPFKPSQPSPSLASFDGHDIYKAGTSLGVKVFDFFNIEGERIVRNPLFQDIDWDDPLNSSIDYKAGFNGTADFAFSIFSVGIFEFPIAETSATIDVGFDIQQMAMQMTIAPDVSWQPDWFPVIPETSMVAEWMINGDETFSASISGTYKSTLPEANMSGSMLLNNDGVALEAKIPDGKVPLEVSAAFRNSQTTYTITTEVDIGDSVQESVDEAFDTIISDKAAALEDLEAKTKDYELEVSLNGLRESLPSIMDGAIATTSTIPSDVRTGVYNAVRKSMKDRQECFIVCVPSNGEINAAANISADAAEDDATSRIAAPLASFRELKFRAQQDDDEAFRQALEDALYDAYSHRQIKFKISVRVKAPSPVKDFTHERNVSETVINSTNSARILSAAQNAFRIQETSDLRIEASNIYDEIPTQQAVEKARADLAEGLTSIPTFEGAGMTVAGNSVTGFVLLSGKQYEADFNLLSPVEMLEGIGATVSSNLVDESNPSE